MFFSTCIVKKLRENYGSYGRIRALFVINLSREILTKKSMEAKLYTQTAEMEPLLPESSLPALADLTCEILRKAGQVSAHLPSPIIQRRVASLVREMNSYYSNLIEGHKTLPRDIERAMRKDYSSNPEKRANQHLSRAHIEVETVMGERLQKEADLSIHSPQFLCWIHREFYLRLPEELQYGKDRKGNNYRVEPGVLRRFEVDVGRHQPPAFDALQKMLDRFASFYQSDRIIPTNQLIALASAHHRLAWIHPFGDGNGRVARLYSHAWLIKCKADALGLWTLSRGLAHKREDYYHHLSDADSERRNDLDCRGNLSDRALGGFCLFFLRTILDQIDFMDGLLQLHNLSTRIERYLQFEALRLKTRDRYRLSRLLKAALIEGEIDRGRVGEIVGLRGTAARGIIALALREELLDSQTEKGPLALVFSAKTLESYFPKLYQDLAVEPAASRSQHP
jgi:Fic family protein